jgi:membrane fusion protein (multidrug efflux system)
MTNGTKMPTFSIARPAVWAGRAVLCASLGLLAACGEPEALTAAVATAAEPTRVVTAAVRREPLGLEIEAVGTAVANQSVEITSKVANKVAAIHFQEGQRVRQGAMLVELDSAQLRAELEGAQATLAESQARFERSKALEATQALSKAEFDQIEATLKANRAAVVTARADLADSVIRAPFSGHVGFRSVSAGSLVSPGTVITTLDDTELIKLDFTVPQIYLHALSVGLPIEALVDGLPGQSFEGKVATVGSRFDPVTRSVTVRAHLPNPKGVLKPGMFMTVKLRAETASALVIPEGALVPEQGKTYVFAVVGDAVEQREVRTGRRRPGAVEVTVGLKEGDVVVVEGTQNIRDGTKVTQVASRQAGARPGEQDGPPMPGAAADGAATGTTVD